MANKRAGLRARLQSLPGQQAASAAPARFYLRAKVRGSSSSIKKRKALTDTAKAIAQHGGEVQTVAADTSNEDDVKAFVDRAVTAFGGLDVVYANAGISGGLVPPPLLEQTVENWLRVLQVNLVGTFLAIKHAAPHMIAKGARLDHSHRLGRGLARQRRRRAL